MLPTNQLLEILRKKKEQEDLAAALPPFESLVPDTSQLGEAPPPNDPYTQARNSYNMQNIADDFARSAAPGISLITNSQVAPQKYGAGATVSSRTVSSSPVSPSTQANLQPTAPVSFDGPALGRTPTQMQQTNPLFGQPPTTQFSPVDKLPIPRVNPVTPAPTQQTPGSAQISPQVPAANPSPDAPPLENDLYKAFNAPKNTFLNTPKPTGSLPPYTESFTGKTSTDPLELGRNILGQPNFNLVNNTIGNQIVASIPKENNDVQLTGDVPSQMDIADNRRQQQSDARVAGQYTGQYDSQGQPLAPKNKGISYDKPIEKIVDLNRRITPDDVAKHFRNQIGFNDASAAAYLKATGKLPGQQELVSPFRAGQPLSQEDIDQYRRLEGYNGVIKLGLTPEAQGHYEEFLRKERDKQKFPTESSPVTDTLATLATLPANVMNAPVELAYSALKGKTPFVTSGKDFTNAVTGGIKGASLGNIDIGEIPSELTSEQKNWYANHPISEAVNNILTPYNIGDVGGGLLPFMVTGAVVGPEVLDVAGKLTMGSELTKLGLTAEQAAEVVEKASVLQKTLQAAGQWPQEIPGAAIKSGATFGTVGALRNPDPTGKNTFAQNLVLRAKGGLEEGTLGAVTGALHGETPGLPRQLGSFIAPPSINELSHGASIGDVAKGQLPNALLSIGMHQEHPEISQVNEPVTENVGQPTNVPAPPQFQLMTKAIPRQPEAFDRTADQSLLPPAPQFQPTVKNISQQPEAFNRAADQGTVEQALPDPDITKATANQAISPVAPKAPIQRPDLQNQNGIPSADEIANMNQEQLTELNNLLTILPVTYKNSAFLDLTGRRMVQRAQELDWGHNLPTEENTDFDFTGSPAAEQLKHEIHEMIHTGVFSNEDIINRIIDHPELPNVIDHLINYSDLYGKGNRQTKIQSLLDMSEEEYQRELKSMVLSSENANIDSGKREELQADIAQIKMLRAARNQQGTPNEIDPNLVKIGSGESNASLPSSDQSSSQAGDSSQASQLSNSGASSAGIAYPTTTAILPRSEPGLPPAAVTPTETEVASNTPLPPTEPTPLESPQEGAITIASERLQYPKEVIKALLTEENNGIPIRNREEAGPFLAQLTQQEYLAATGKANENNPDALWDETNNHRNAVVQSVADGEPVPYEVLNDPLKEPIPIFAEDANGDFVDTGRKANTYQEYIDIKDKPFEPTESLPAESESPNNIISDKLPPEKTPSKFDVLLDTTKAFSPTVSVMDIAPAGEKNASHRQAVINIDGEKYVGPEVPTSYTNSQVANAAIRQYGTEKLNATNTKPNTPERAAAEKSIADALYKASKPMNRQEIVAINEDGLQVSVRPSVDNNGVLTYRPYGRENGQSPWLELGGHIGNDYESAVINYADANEGVLGFKWIDPRVEVAEPRPVAKPVATSTPTDVLPADSTVAKPTTPAAPLPPSTPMMPRGVPDRATKASITTKDGVVEGYEAFDEPGQPQKKFKEAYVPLPDKSGYRKVSVDRANIVSRETLPTSESKPTSIFGTPNPEPKIAEKGGGIGFLGTAFGHSSTAGPSLTVKAAAARQAFVAQARNVSNFIKNFIGAKSSNIVLEKTGTVKNNVQLNLKKLNYPDDRAQQVINEDLNFKSRLTTRLNDSVPENDALKQTLIDAGWSTKSIPELSKRLWEAAHGVSEIDDKGNVTFNTTGIAWDVLNNSKDPNVQSSDVLLDAIDKENNAYHAAKLKDPAAPDNRKYNENGLPMAASDFNIEQLSDGRFRIFRKFRPNEAEDAYASGVTGKNITYKELQTNSKLENAALKNVLTEVDKIRKATAKEMGITPIDGHVHHYSEQTSFFATRRSMGEYTAGPRNLRTGALFAGRVAGKEISKDVFGSLLRMKQEFIKENEINNHVTAVMDLLSRKVEGGVVPEGYTLLDPKKSEFGKTLARLPEDSLKRFGFDDEAIKQIRQFGYASQANGIMFPTLTAEMMKYALRERESSPVDKMREKSALVDHAYAFWQDANDIKTLSMLILAKSGTADATTSLLGMHPWRMGNDLIAGAMKASRGEIDPLAEFKSGIKEYGRTAGRIAEGLPYKIVNAQAAIPVWNKLTGLKNIGSPAVPEHLQPGVLPESVFNQGKLGEGPLGRAILPTLSKWAYVKQQGDSMGKEMEADTTAQAIARRHSSMVMQLTGGLADELTYSTHNGTRKIFLPKDTSYTPPSDWKLQSKSVKDYSSIKNGKEVAYDDMYRNLPDEARAKIREDAGFWAFGRDHANPNLSKYTENLLVKTFVSDFPGFFNKMMSLQFGFQQPLNSRNLYAANLETAPAKIQLDPRDFATDNELKKQAYDASQEYASRTTAPIQYGPNAPAGNYAKPNPITGNPVEAAAYKAVREYRKQYLDTLTKKRAEAMAAKRKDIAKHNQGVKDEAIARIISGGTVSGLALGAAALGLSAIGHHKDKEKPEPSKYNESLSFPIPSDDPNKTRFVSTQSLSPGPEEVGMAQLLSGQITVAEWAKSRSLGTQNSDYLLNILGDYKRGQFAQNLPKQLAGIGERYIPGSSAVRWAGDVLDPDKRKTTGFFDTLQNDVPIIRGEGAKVPGTNIGFGGLPPAPDLQTGALTTPSSGNSALPGIFQRGLKEAYPNAGEQGNEGLRDTVGAGLGRIARGILPSDVKEFDNTDRAVSTGPGSLALKSTTADIQRIDKDNKAYFTDEEKAALQQRLDEGYIKAQATRHASQTGLVGQQLPSGVNIPGNLPAFEKLYPNLSLENQEKARQEVAKYSVDRKVIEDQIVKQFLAETGRTTNMPAYKETLPVISNRNATVDAKRLEIENMIESKDWYKRMNPVQQQKYKDMILGQLMHGAKVQVKR